MIEIILENFFNTNINYIESNLHKFGELNYNYLNNKNLELIRYAILNFSIINNKFNSKFFNDNIIAEINLLKKYNFNNEIFNFIYENINQELEYIEIIIHEKLITFIESELNNFIFNLKNNQTILENNQTILEDNQTILENNQTILEEELEKQKILKEELEKQKKLEEELEKQKILKEELEKQKKLEEELEKQKILEDELNKQKILKEELEKHKILEDELEKQKIIEEELEKQKKLEEELEKQKLLEEKLEKQKILEEELEKQKILEEELEKQKILEEEFKKQKLLENELKKKVEINKKKTKKIDFEERELEKKNDILEFSKEDIKDENEDKKIYLLEKEKEKIIFLLKTNYKKKIDISCFIYLNEENGINSIINSLLESENNMDININYELIIYYNKINIDKLMLKIATTAAIKITFIEKKYNFLVSLIKSESLIESNNLFVLKPFAYFRPNRFMEHLNELEKSNIILDCYALYLFRNKKIGYNYNLVKNQLKIPCSINLTLKKDLLSILNKNNIIELLKKIKEKYYLHLMNLINNINYEIKICYLNNKQDMNKNIENEKSLIMNTNNLFVIKAPFYII